MDGYQSIIEFRLNLAAFCPMPEEGFENGERLVRITQLQTEQNREQSSDNGPYDTGNQELLTDGLMVHAEDILRDEGLLMVTMSVIIMMYSVCCSGMYM